MELKQYQREVIDDLRAYLDILKEVNNPQKAFDEYWSNKGVIKKESKVSNYHGLEPSTPDICLKVPTGGGKTFIACAALREIFGTFGIENKVVLWMVPNTAIYNQVVSTFTNTEHPYRQRLDMDFNGRVQIIDIEDMISACDFTLPALGDRLTVAILTYQSLRSEINVKLRSNKNNPQLQSFSPLFSSQDPVDDVNSPALKDVLSKLHPVIVLDESHNADTELSRTMLKRLSPSFILELTATPNDSSNVISYISAIQLKKEEMVKIPVFLFGRPDPENLLGDVIRHRNYLEELAIEIRKQTGRYLRPIALIQAQPRNDEDSITFDKLKKNLIASGKVREDEVAIKMSNRDELKGKDLLSESCNIRYIITVNALKEGWDCPFAYILCTVASGKSELQVEQILGRVLRQPNAKRYNHPMLNASYVFSTSDTFQKTLNVVADGLLKCGFSKKDYIDSRKLNNLDRYINDDEDVPEDPVTQDDEDTTTDEINRPETEENPWDNLDPSKVGEIVDNPDVPSDEMKPDIITKSIENFENEEETKEEEREVPKGMVSCMSKIQKKYQDEIKDVRIPYFVYHDVGKLDNEPYTEKVSKEYLCRDFNPNIRCDKVLKVSLTGADMAKFDTKDESYTLSLSMLKQQEQAMFQAHFQNAVSKDSQLVKSFISDLISALNEYREIKKNTRSNELRQYVTDLVLAHDINEINALRKNVPAVVEALANKLEDAMSQYREDVFKDKIKDSTITCDSEHYYKFPPEIDPSNNGKTPIEYDNSLYDVENIPNSFELSVIHKLMESDSVRWWHRIVERKPGEFCLNGYESNHYPDFVLMTERGRIILVETKGSHLDGSNSEMKAKLGDVWQSKAGDQFRYFMVFENENRKINESISLEELMRYIEKL